MPTYAHDFDEDDFDDWEAAADEAASDEDTTAEEDTTDECPYCHESIYDDTERCPHCGSYLSEEDRPPRPKPWWLLAGVTVCLYIIYRWTFG